MILEHPTEMQDHNTVVHRLRKESNVASEIQSEIHQAGVPDEGQG